MTLSYLIREALEADQQALFDLVPRLRAFGPAPVRPPDALDEAERNALARFFRDPPAGSRLWVAEDASQCIVGAAYAERATDYFTHEAHGHLAILMVSETASGRGIGRALMQTVEEWSKASGFRFLTLNVFASNSAARAFYEHAGFIPDIVRYIKSFR